MLSKAEQGKAGQREAMQQMADRLQREAIQRLLNRPEIRHENVAKRIGVSQKELDNWFSGGAALPTKAFARLRAIAVPKPGTERHDREQWAGAAFRQILQRINGKKSPRVARVL